MKFLCEDKMHEPQKCSGTFWLPEQILLPSGCACKNVELEFEDKYTEDGGDQEKDEGEEMKNKTT